MVVPCFCCCPTPETHWCRRKYCTVDHGGVAVSPGFLNLAAVWMRCSSDHPSDTLASFLRRKQHVHGRFIASPGPEQSKEECQSINTSWSIWTEAWSNLMNSLALVWCPSVTVVHAWSILFLSLLGVLSIPGLDRTSLLSVIIWVPPPYFFGLVASTATQSYGTFRSPVSTIKRSSMYSIAQYFHDLVVFG